PPTGRHPLASGRPFPLTEAQPAESSPLGVRSVGSLRGVHMKFWISVICATVVTLSTAMATLRLTDPVEEWHHASLDERLTVASALVIVAGQGREDTTEEFFGRCLDDIADEPLLAGKQISDVANACLLMRSYFLTDAEW